MKIQLILLTPTGQREKKTLDDENTGLITIGNAAANPASETILRLDSDEIDTLHAQLAFRRRPLPEEEQNPTPLVCHLIIFSDKQNVYRANRMDFITDQQTKVVALSERSHLQALTTPVVQHQFIPWYAGDAFAFGPYTVLFDQEATTTMPFTVDLMPAVTAARNYHFGEELTWQVTVKTKDDRVANVRLKFLPPENLREIKSLVTEVQPNLLNINETKEGRAILRFSVPKDLRCEARTHSFLLQLKSEDYQHYTPYTIEIKINIPPFYKFEFKPQPPFIQGRTIFFLRTLFFWPQFLFVLRNWGNQKEKYKLSVADPFDKWRSYLDDFRAEPTTDLPPTPMIGAHEVEVESNQQVLVRMRTQPKRRTWFGRPKTYDLTIAAGHEESNETQSHLIKLRQWAFFMSPSFFMLFILLFFVSAWLLSPRITIEPSPLAYSQPNTITWNVSGWPGDTTILPAEGVVASPSVLVSSSWIPFLRQTYESSFVPRTVATSTISITAQNGIYQWSFLGAHSLPFDASMTRLWGYDLQNQRFAVWPVVTVSDVIFQKGETKNFIVSLTNRPSNTNTITVTYTLLDDTAVHGTDYNGVVTGILLFNSSKITNPITITSLPDAPYAPLKTFTFTLSNLVGEALFPSHLEQLSAKGAIAVDVPSIAISDTVAAEGAGTMPFIVTLGYAVSEDVVVDFAFEDGSAKQITDYMPINSSLVITAGEMTGTLKVNVISNTIIDGNKQFSVKITSAKKVSVNPQQSDQTILPIMKGFAVGTILDDEPTPTPTLTAVPPMPTFLPTPTTIPPTSTPMMTAVPPTPTPTPSTIPNSAAVIESFDIQPSVLSLGSNGEPTSAFLFWKVSNASEVLIIRQRGDEVEEFSFSPDHVNRSLCFAKEGTYLLTIKVRSTAQSTSVTGSSKIIEVRKATNGTVPSPNGTVPPNTTIGC